MKRARQVYKFAERIKWVKLIGTKVYIHFSRIEKRANKIWLNM